MTKPLDVSAEFVAVWNLLAENGEVRYFAKRADGQAQGGRVRSVKALERVGANLGLLGYDIYVHLNPSVGPGLKAKSSQVTHWRRILIDLDPIDPTTPATESIRRLLGMAEELLPGVSAASTIIDSGRGAQAWASIRHGACGDVQGADEEVLLRSKVERNRIEGSTSAFLRALHVRWDGRDGYQVDTTTSDLGRIARCPGTTNTRTARVATVLEAGTGYICGRRLIELYPPIGRSESEDRPHIQLVRGEKTANLITVSPHLNELAREFLHAGVSEGNRHHAAFAAARSLLEIGMPAPSVKYWVLRGASRCRPKLKQHEALHCFRMALKKEEEIADSHDPA